MRILYYSILNGSKASGPNISVPASIKAQSKYDDVFWVNLCKTSNKSWSTLPYFYKGSSFSKLSLMKTCQSFHFPDIIVFEELYSIKVIIIAIQAYFFKIPYVIIPRGGLTKQAFNNRSKWKKKIAHILAFDIFIRHAKAIQFLSEQERKNTRKFINNSWFILPNGVNMPLKKKEYFSRNSIKGVFIGRIDVYQKGLDLLIDAIAKEQKFLRSNNFSLSIYGPVCNNTSHFLQTIIDTSINDLVSIKMPVFGEEKQKVLLESDVFFLTSRSEGHPLALIEALSYGLPSFVTTGTGLREVIEKSNAGWGCDFGIDDVRKALKIMINSRMSFYSMSKAAIEIVKEYDWNELSFSFHNTISNLTNKL